MFADRFQHRLQLIARVPATIGQPVVSLLSGNPSAKKLDFCDVIVKSRQPLILCNLRLKEVSVHLMKKKLLKALHQTRRRAQMSNFKVLYLQT